MREGLTFDDVLIIPKFSEIESRSQVSLSTNIRSLTMNLPIISANMDTVTESLMASSMEFLGAQACLHRFQTIEKNVHTFKQSKLGFGDRSYDGPMVSVGLGLIELDRAITLFDSGAHTFIIDVANGAQKTVVNQINSIRNVLGNHINLIVGNFASTDSVQYLIDRVGNKVDAIKIGIGPGSACTTRVKTGVGYPQISAILEISQLLKNTDIKIIADGGMKNSGDIAKALAAGAHMAMLGGMLAGTRETPGNIVDEDGEIVFDNYGTNYSKTFKKYRGSASKESYDIQGKDTEYRTAEGESFYVPYKGPIKDILKNIEGGLRSAMTYVGAKTLEEFRNKAEFVRITNAGHAESFAHGKK